MRWAMVVGLVVGLALAAPAGAMIFRVAGGAGSGGAVICAGGVGDFSDSCNSSLLVVLGPAR